MAGRQLPYDLCAGGHRYALNAAVSARDVHEPRHCPLKQVSSATAGALGSAVSQGVGVATGNQDKFSFKGVALAALSTGVGAGVGQVLGNGALAGSQFLGNVARGALGSALTQGIAVATGLQDRFDWAGVAAAGVGSGVGGALEPSIATAGLGRTGAQAATVSAIAIASAATRSAIEGSSFGQNLLDALPNAIGQVVGGAIGDALKRTAQGSRATRALEAAKTDPKGTARNAIGDADLPVDTRIDTTGKRLGFDLGGGLDGGSAASTRNGQSSSPTPLGDLGDRDANGDIVVTARKTPRPVTIVEPASTLSISCARQRTIEAQRGADRRDGVSYDPESEARIDESFRVEQARLREEISRADTLLARQGLAGLNVAAREAEYIPLPFVPLAGAAIRVATGDQTVRDAAANAAATAIGGKLLAAGGGAIISRIGARTVAAETVGSTGLRGTSIVSAERAQTFLVKNVFTPARAQEFIGSFDGPITARIVRPGEDFLRYTDYADSTGSFLTKTRFGSPAEAVDGLYLAPYGNGAALVQPVTSTGRSIVLEGAIKNGGRGIGQTVIQNRGAFYFGPGVEY